MTLVGELTLAFLLESLALAAFWGALGTAAAALVLSAAGRRLPSPAALARPALAGLAGAMAAGSLSLRFGAPEPVMVVIGRRDVPLVWSIAGALAGGAIAMAAGRYARRGSTRGQSISG